MASQQEWSRIVQEAKDTLETQRKRNLERLFLDDLMIDKGNLKRGFSQNPSSKRTISSMSMDGRPGYILEDLFEYAKSLFKNQEKEFTGILDLIKREDYLSETTEAISDVSVSFHELHRVFLTA